MERCRGWVERIYFGSERFCAGRLRSEDGRLVEFAGPVAVRESEAVVLEGDWVAHPRYGRQLRTARVEYERPDDVAALVPHPGSRVREIPRASTPVEQSRAVWTGSHGPHRALGDLSDFGLTHHQTSTLADALGPAALAILQADPYRLLHAIPGFGFQRLDAIALRLGVAGDFAGRIRAGLLCALDQVLEQGDCWIEHAALVQRAHGVLGLDVAEGFERIADALDALIERETLVRARHGESSLVARPEIDGMERELAGFLAGAAEPNPHFASLGAPELDALVRAGTSAGPTGDADPLPALNADQEEAVRMALRRRIALLCGGAGTGKTRTVAALAALCAERGLEVVLAAPTGKAAKRLEEVSGREAFTLHRLLGFNGRFYLRGPEDPVPADVLIVDEVSMLNLALAWQLFRSLDLTRTAVLLVGDPNQLPPIGPGNPLRDLVATRALPTVLLESIVRQAGVLKAHSLAVLSGTVAPDAGPWRVFDQWVNPRKAQRFVLELFESLLEEGAHAQARADIQVLTPIHRGPLGTGELNQALQRLLQKRLFGVDVPPVAAHERPRFLLHDRVIQTRNDYDLGVMNGSIGVIRDADRRGGLRVEFDGKTVELEPRSESLQDLQLAYALTIHKTQGSEFSCAIVIVHRAHAFMHHRNLLYTAVTRARDRVFLIGDRLSLQGCASKHHQDQRRTLLATRLRELGAPGC